jgi:hypothetical protein
VAGRLSAIAAAGAPGRGSRRRRVADVELDQFAALGLELERAPGEFAADLVTDFGQALAGMDTVGHRLDRAKNGLRGYRFAASFQRKTGT